MRQLLRRIRYLIERDRHEADLVDELTFHREMKEQELRESGIVDANLAIGAQRALGNDLTARQHSRDVWVAPWLQDISQDVRFGARMLLKDRRFTLAAVTALSLGIAVNNSVFTIVNAAVLRDLPFDQPDRLIDVRLIDKGGLDGVSYDDFQRLQEVHQTIEGLAAQGGGTMNISEAGRTAERHSGAYVSANTLRILRVEPVLGRGFRAEDEQPGAPAVAIIGFDLWQSRYGADPAVVGRSVKVNDTPTTIIGVMPQGFGYPVPTRLWTPLTQLPGLTTTASRQRRLTVISRLADGATIAHAHNELDTQMKRAPADLPNPDVEQRVVVKRLKDAQTGGGSTILSTLMVAVGFVLLIACANVTSLLLARSTHRSREFAIRSSLGATRWRVTRQLLIECTLIAAVAGVLGWMLSRYGAAVMADAFTVTEIGAPDQVTRPYWVNLGMNGVAWLFLLGTCVVASLGTGLLPAWHLSKTTANEVLKDSGRAGSTASSRRWTGALLVGELALTVILLTGAGLLLRSFLTQYFKDLRIDPSNVVTMRLELPAQKYEAPEQRKRFVNDLDTRLAAIRLFSSVTIASDIPLQPLGFPTRMLAIEDRVGEKLVPVTFVNVGPRYFETLGLPLVRGRAFSGEDEGTGRESVIVNQLFAARFFPDIDPLGRRVQLSGATLPPNVAPWLTIVGVVPTLPNFFRGRADDPVIYVPMGAERAPQRVVSVIVRVAGPESSGAKAAAASALRDEVAAMDADLPLFAIQTLDEAVARGRLPNRIMGSWFATLALIALVLATVGLYALTAHGVAQRVREIGVRMALGADAASVIWLFTRRTVFQLAVGLVLGLSGAIALGQALRSFLRDTDARDPATLAGVAALVTLVALLASVLPARRAARVDPAVALRAE